MLNIDKKSKTEYYVSIDQSNYVEYMFQLGSQIEIEKRKVTSLPSLFGEIGGLNDFFA